VEAIGREVKYDDNGSDNAAVRRDIHTADKQSRPMKSRQKVIMDIDKNSMGGSVQDLDQQQKNF